MIFAIISSTYYKLDLCGTPGYLAPEVLKCNMFDSDEGYGLRVDMYVVNISPSDSFGLLSLIFFIFFSSCPVLDLLVLLVRCMVTTRLCNV